MQGVSPPLRRMPIRASLPEKLARARHYAEWLPFINSFNSFRILIKKVQLLF